MEPGERYSDVVIDKRIVGKTQDGDTTGSAYGHPTGGKEGATSD